jgi:hypothetical protein
MFAFTCVISTTWFSSTFLTLGDRATLQVNICYYSMKSASRDENKRNYCGLWLGHLQKDSRNQRRTQEFFRVGRGRDSTNSVQDRGNRERWSGGGSPPSQLFRSICKWVKPAFLLGCYGCIFHGTRNSTWLSQNFGISVGGGGWPPPPLVRFVPTSVENKIFHACIW